MGKILRGDSIHLDTQFLTNYEWSKRKLKTVRGRQILYFYTRQKHTKNDGVKQIELYVSTNFVNN